MPGTNIPNEVANQVALYGTETIAGEAVTPTARLLGEFTSSKSQAIRRKEEATGGYDRLLIPRREQATYDGSYGEDLTYESFPALLRYGVTGGGTGTGDSNSTEGFTYTKSPNPTEDDIDSMTVQTGVEGLGFQSTGVRFDEFTIAADSTDSDDAWKFSSNLFLRDRVPLPGAYTGVATAGTTSTVEDTTAMWTVDGWQGAWVYLDYGTHIGPVRRVASNTATELTLESPALDTAPTTGDRFHIAGMFPVIPNPEQEAITLEGSKLYLDAYDASGSTVGTTDVSRRILSFSITQTLNIAQKRRFPGIIARVGRGARWYTGVLRFEFDRWDEYMNWANNDALSIRIEREGGVIDSTEGTHKLARIDVEKAYFDTITDDADNNNWTASLAFIAAIPASEPIVTFTGVNTLATLP